jgi:hypothetical protein
MGRFLPLNKNLRASLVCRSLPPALHVSVSLLEKADAQIPLASVSDVPETDTDDLKASDDFRPRPDAHLSEEAS